MKQQAKPCPFCATPDPESWDDDGVLMVSCANLLCHRSNDYMPMDDWNTRPLEDALLEACKALVYLVSFVSKQAGIRQREIDASPAIVAALAAIARAEGDA